MVIENGYLSLRGYQHEFQAESFDLTGFGSSSAASVKAQLYEIWMTQSHQRTMEYSISILCVLIVCHLILTFKICYKLIAGGKLGSLQRKL